MHRSHKLDDLGSNPREPTIFALQLLYKDINKAWVPGSNPGRRTIFKFLVTCLNKKYVYSWICNLWYLDCSLEDLCMLQIFLLSILSGREYFALVAQLDIASDSFNSSSRDPNWMKGQDF